MDRRSGAGDGDCQCRGFRHGGRADRLSGATRWLTSGKAMIVLSLRHKSNDHFWFTFFHEAAHILKHGKTDVYVDEEDRMQTKQEAKADAFAANSLIPDRDYKCFTSDNRNRFSRSTVLQFARQINVAPGIVVGRLQHDKYVDYSWLNNLKVKFKLIEYIKFI